MPGAPGPPLLGTWETTDLNQPGAGCGCPGAVGSNFPTEPGCPRSLAFGDRGWRVTRAPWEANSPTEPGCPRSLAFGDRGWRVTRAPWEANSPTEPGCPRSPAFGDLGDHRPQLPWAPPRIWGPGMEAKIFFSEVAGNFADFVIIEISKVKRQMRVTGRSKTPRPMRGSFVSAIAGRIPSLRRKSAPTGRRRAKNAVTPLFSIFCQ